MPDRANGYPNDEYGYDRAQSGGEGFFAGYGSDGNSDRASHRDRESDAPRGRSAAPPRRGNGARSARPGASNPGAKSGASRSGVKSGSSKSGPSKTGTAKTGTTKTGTAKTGPSKNGAGGNRRSGSGTNGSGTKGSGSKGSGSKKRKRVRSPWWTKLTIALGVLFLLVSGGVYGGWTYLQGELNSSFKSTDLLGNDVQQHNSINGPINLLLVGLDTRPDNTIGSRSDSIIIAHIPASHDSVYLVSIPRDTNAYIPPDQKTGWKGGDLKINAAFEEGSMKGGGQKGGFELLAQTIKRDYGITFNGGGIVAFDGFSDIVNKLGGVRMYVDEKTISIHHGYLTSNPKVKAKPYVINPNTGAPAHGFAHPIAGVTPVVYNVGWHNFTAYEALDYVRIRDGLVGTDYARQRHQQQFLKALITKMMNQGLTSPTKLPGFLQSLGKAITMDWGNVSITDWLFTLKGITPNALVTIKTNDGQYDSYTGPAPDARQQLNATSQLMLQDVVHDKMAEFVAQYPSWVSTS